MKQKELKYGIMVSMVLMLMLAFTGAASAATTTISPSDNLQDTIYAANDGDIIMMAPGYYNITPNSLGYQHLHINKTDLTLQADGGEVIIGPQGEFGSAGISASPRFVLGKDEYGTTHSANGLTLKGITVANISLINNKYTNTMNMHFEDCAFIGNPDPTYWVDSDMDVVLYLYDNAYVGNCAFSDTLLRLDGNNVTFENNDVTGTYFGNGYNSGLLDIIVRNNSFTSLDSNFAGHEILFENNVLEASTELVWETDSENFNIRNNVFANTTGNLYLGGQLYENTFTSCDVVELNYPGGSCSFYLNNFIDTSPVLYSATYNTSTPVTYTYGGASYTGYLGNYYSDYAGSDANGDGVGEDAYSLDSYPLMGAWDAATDTIIRNPATITINPGDDLQAVLDSAVSGDTLYFTPGDHDYSVTDAGNPVTFTIYDKSITLTGAGADVVTLDLGFNGWDFGYSNVRAPYNITIENINFAASVNTTCTSPPEAYWDYAESNLHIYYAEGDVVIRNCTFLNTSISTYNAGNVDFSDNVVDSHKVWADARLYEFKKTLGSVRVSGNTMNGAYVLLNTGTSAEIYGNTFTNTPELPAHDNKPYDGAVGPFNDALWLYGVTGATVSDNTFSGNVVGIQLDGSTNCAISENDFNTNDAAIDIVRVSSSDNTICLNNFVDNTVNYLDGGSNTGAISYGSDAMAYTYMGNSLGPSALGNYYSDYTGTDAAIDGIGDTAYTAVAGNDAAPLMGAWDAATDTIEVTPYVLSFIPGDTSVIEGQETQVQIMASAFPEGLSGYNLTVAVDDPTVAEIVDIEYPTWASITSNSSLPGTSIYLKALDGSSQVQADAEDVVIATLTISGKGFGSTGLTIGLSDEGMDDDFGTAIDATLSTGALEVTMTPLPGQTVSPQDIGGNGLYEDLNGDGEIGFVDVEAFFNNKEWIDANLPVANFDFNGNGRIDFDDIVNLFELVVV